MNILNFFRKKKREYYTRFDVLKNAEKHEDDTLGLCSAITKSIYDLYNIEVLYDHLKELFPEFSLDNAKKLGFNPCYYDDNVYRWWWKPGEWNGRKRFLKWLIKYYKNDTSDFKDELKVLRYDI